jgi:hypothetical protein
MVRGLDVFQRYFRAHNDKYVLIGGAACDLALGSAGVGFCATQDLFIFFRIEVLYGGFFKTFLEFIRAGKYRNLQQSTGLRQFYRFKQPAKEGFPFMLELFSRKPDALELPEDCHLTPIPAGEDVSSLSAILLNDDYYAFLHAGRKEVENISIAGPERLIPLKARAWLDLRKREQSGEKIDSRDIKKHKNDVFRLYRVIDPEHLSQVPKVIREDMESFLNAMKAEKTDLGALGIKDQSLESVLNELRRIYCGS